MEFIEFPKIARLNRDCIVTEKIDGTNASIFIEHESVVRASGLENVDCWMRAGDEWFIAAASRTRWITPNSDNFGFARWVFEHKEELVELGQGLHRGEWWGSGIQRGYGLPKGEKRFSLFDTSRWAEQGALLIPGQSEAPMCCHVVPVLYRGKFDSVSIETVMERLRYYGSVAAPGFMRPEGIVVYHTAANIFFKATLEKDELPKALAR